ncbi:MAG: hypothetical protein LC102_04485 [Ignavibacteriales bacterium]|nr:MAG: hypothetical protein F9K26_10220 [Ignavibacteriaceae bacterium]MBW7874289.1 hypothetical protein [Ignavibacteria bacterium]MCZ2142667.1 hypothetical protein [Ignavibacteriales bacterium]OQY73476.1 MAG: hypothetical protein B6D45_08120 [Ignavibacteriales bacterium UTCHB3]MBV6443765.1 hypothetical protein [Ignavibacteriaceae bacterium]
MKKDQFSRYLSILIVAFFVLQVNAAAQKVKPTDQSNPKLLYEDFITGFDEVWVELSPSAQQLIDTPEGDNQLTAIKKYIKELGFNKIIATTPEKIAATAKATTSCNFLKFEFKWKTDGFDISNISITVSDCNGTWFLFSRKGVVKVDYSVDRTLLVEWRKLLNHKRLKYDPTRTPQIFKGTVGLTEEEFRKKLNAGAQDIEGIYELMKTPGATGIEQKLRIGVQKVNDVTYKIYYFEGALFKDDWQNGEYKGEITKTGKKDFFKVQWKDENKLMTENVFCSSSEQGILLFQFIKDSGTVELQFLKLYPVF